MSIVFGEIIYADRKYHFEFENNILQMYEFNSELISDLEQSIPLVALFPGEKPQIDSLTGVCYPDGHSIVFLDVVDAGTKNNVLLNRVSQYIEYKMLFCSSSPISGLSIQADELNYIYPVGQTYNYTMNETGINSINLQASTGDQQWVFNLNEIRVTVSFGIMQSFTHDESPLRLQSALYMEFEPTEDHEFITRLFAIGRNFLRYVCYRRNINITKSSVYTHDGKRKFCPIGSFDAAWLHTDYPETKKRMQRNYIPVSSLGTSLGYFFQKLSDDTLYLRHIPASIKDARGITPAHSVMLTAAFEYEYHQLFPEGIKHKAKTQKKHELIKTGLDSLISDEKYDSVKKEFERAKNILTNDNLEAQLNQAFKELSVCFESHAKSLFDLNETEYSTSIMAKTISKMRNDFAHGNINIDYGKETFLSITILPYLIYAMQLKQAGLDESEITKIIGKLLS